VCALKVHIRREQCPVSNSTSALACDVNVCHVVYYVETPELQLVDRTEAPYYYVISSKADRGDILITHDKKKNLVESCLP